MADELIELGRIRCGKGEVRRKGYITKHGVRVAPACTPDKGAKGKTHASKKWFPGGVEVPGWSKEKTAKQRRAGLKQLVDKKTMPCDLLKRNMNAIANVTTDKETKQKMRSDRTWVAEGPCKS